MALKASIYLHLKQFDELRELVDAFLERNPDNPLMLSHAAVLALDEQDVDEAVVLLQNALDQIDEQRFGLAMTALLRQGRGQAARDPAILAVETRHLSSRERVECCFFSKP